MADQNTPIIDAFMARWDADGATRGAAFTELRDVARELERCLREVQELSMRRALDLDNVGRTIEVCAKAISIEPATTQTVQGWMDLVRNATAAALAPLDADDVEWIVNDMGELGVRVRGRCYFCYKGESLVYEHGIHDGGEPILHRNVGKREFGETVWPPAWVTRGYRQDRYTLELVYTPGLSFGPPDNSMYKWLPLPVEVPNAHS